MISTLDRLLTLNRSFRFSPAFFNLHSFFGFPALSAVFVFFRRFPIVVVVVLSLFGCTASPLHTSRSGASSLSSFPASMIVTPSGISGHRLRLALLDALTVLNSEALAVAPSCCRLEVAISESSAPLLIQRSGATSRRSYRLDAVFTLRRAEGEDDAPMLSGKTHAVIAFNQSRSGYASLQTERNAKKRAAAVVADHIALRLAAYFKTARPAL